MEGTTRYNVDIARDDPINLAEVLEHIATRKGHVQIVSVTWQPARSIGDKGFVRDPGYTIISERKP